MVIEDALSEEICNQISSQYQVNPPIGEIQNLRQQLAKLDPAHKGLRFRGLKDESLKKRVEALEMILRDAGLGLDDKPEFFLDHIYKGPSNARVLTDMCVVTFQSNSIREIVLKQVRGKTQYDLSRNELTIDRAKTASQLARNSALRRASDILKKDPRCTGKSVEIMWRMTDLKNKSREVQVEGVPVFQQGLDDPSGIFVGIFADLKV